MSYRGNDFDYNSQDECEYAIKIMHETLVNTDNELVRMEDGKLVNIYEGEYQEKPYIPCHANKADIETNFSKIEVLIGELIFNAQRMDMFSMGERSEKIGSLMNTKIALKKAVTKLIEEIKRLEKENKELRNE